MDKKDIISVQNNNFPEYEDIRKAILEAKEKLLLRLMQQWLRHIG